MQRREFFCCCYSALLYIGSEYHTVFCGVCFCSGSFSLPTCPSGSRRTMGSSSGAGSLAAAHMGAFCMLSMITPLSTCSLCCCSLLLQLLLTRWWTGTSASCSGTPASCSGTSESCTGTSASCTGTPASYSGISASCSGTSPGDSLVGDHLPLQGCGYKYTSGDHCLALSSCSFKMTFSLSCVTAKVLTQCYTIHLKIPKAQCAVTSFICSAVGFAIEMYRFDK